MAKKNPSEMDFLGHLEELRWRIFKSLVTVIAFAIPCGIYWKQIFDVIMIWPLRFANPKPHLIITSPIEAVMLSVKIAIACGLVCAIPVVFYQIWRFVAPGLYKKEKVLILPTVIAASFSFILGVGFCYLILPYMLKFLAAYGGGRMDPFFRMNEYLSFLLMLSLAFGFIFELPVISFVLTRVGILTPKFLFEKGRYIVVVIFIVAAVITPPDVLSQLLMAIPLLFLYGISIGVSWLAQGKKKEK
jgi:sec-independent protein translocase protein TatC